MLLIGILLFLLGSGTFVLDVANIEPTILAWAEALQPWLSIGLGGLGLALMAGKLFLGDLIGD